MKATAAFSSKDRSVNVMATRGRAGTKKTDVSLFLPVSSVSFAINDDVGLYVLGCRVDILGTKLR